MLFKFNHQNIIFKSLNICLVMFKKNIILNVFNLIKKYGIGHKNIKKIL